ncbi:MAG: T9SS type A sorting domain-containing protein, partial [Ignavibacteriaceae bacterium]
IYHLMWHPQVLFPDIDKNYLNGHLDYISNHNDIWYVCLGDLYLYHLLQTQDIDENPAQVTKDELKPADSFELLQNFPNPFNPDTKIRFTVRYRNHVEIKLFNILGKEVTEITNSDYNPGKYEVNLKGENLSSGVYFCRMQSGNFSKTIKIVLEK